jgi:nucleotide-binding universal stress UspA family protein
VDPDASVEEVKARMEERLTARGMASLGSLEVLPSESAVDAIVREAGHYDLTVVGPSGRPGLLRAIFSNKSQKIAEDAPSSVLLVWSQENSGG